MTDADWLSCTTRPKAMLTAVRRRASGRKLQLLACGVCRLVWEHVPEPACRAAVAAAERFADGLLPADEFQAMMRAALRYQHIVYARSTDPALSARERTTARRASAAAIAVTGVDSVDSYGGLRLAIDTIPSAAPRTAKASLVSAQCDLFRELFPPPSQKYKSVPSFAGGGLLLPNGRVFHVPDTAVRLTESTVADGDYARLPILADALEEFDYPDAELLHHLRHGTNHARGCWAIDAVLGRT